MRPTSEQQALPRGHRKANRRFTTDQRDTWVGSHMCAAEECGASEAFQRKCAPAPAPNDEPNDERSDGWRGAQRSAGSHQQLHWLACVRAQVRPLARNARERVRSVCGGGERQARLDGRELVLNTPV